MNEGPKHPGQGKEYWKAVDIYEKGKNDAQSDVIDATENLNKLRTGHHICSRFL